MQSAGQQSTLEHLAQLVAARTGIVTARAPDDFERAAQRTMHKLAIDDIDEFVGRLDVGNGWDDLIDEVTVGETYFFRNPEQFELVRDTLLPAIARARAPGHVLRLWSAGCASGEEAYSLAILLREAGLLDGARVYGTDISSHALAKAQTACYRDWAFRAVDASLSALYFRAEPAGRTLRDAIREHVRFLQLNLASLDYLAGGEIRNMDLIFCRNVLIYFDAETIAHVERKLFETLAPGGWLVTGPSDPLLGQRAPFEVVSTPRGICYRRPMTLQRVAPLSAAVSDVHEIVTVHSAARVSSRPAPARPRRPPSTPAVLGQHALAKAAFAQADYARVIEIARLHPNDPALAVFSVRATWNQLDSLHAERACGEALRQHSLSTELRYLHAVALMECHRLPEALCAVEKALYLDRRLLIAHFTHGTILERLHDLDGARRAYRNAYDGAMARRPDEELAFADGIVASGLAMAAERALLALQPRRVG